jgi:hypothetical protein
MDANENRITGSWSEFKDSFRDTSILQSRLEGRRSRVICEWKDDELHITVYTRRSIIAGVIYSPGDSDQILWRQEKKSNFRFALLIIVGAVAYAWFRGWEYAWIVSIVAAIAVIRHLDPPGFATVLEKLEFEVQ